MSASPLRDLLAPARLTEVVDVGANPIDGDPPYKAMLAAGLCKVTGFEPQKDALAQLERGRGPNERYLPDALGDGERHTLHVCRASGMTSLLRPDAATLDLFTTLKQVGEVVAREPIQTRRLDTVDNVVELDFLKMDVQGAELAVLQGGRDKLARAVAVQTEVSFVTLYEGQPGLGEIDVELRRQGFIPHCFAALKRWLIAPCIVDGSPNKAINQVLEADLVYVRDFARPRSMSDEQLKHLALVAHHCYGSFDLALRCVMVLEERRALPAGSQARYLGSLGR